MKYDKNRSARKHKGASVIDFPNRYCVVDIETTGLKPEQSEIIELGAVMYENGSETARFNELIKPHKMQDCGLYISPYITELTGIDDKMVENAPFIEHVLPEFEEFLGNALIMGYNVTFDVNFIYDNFVRHLGRPLTNDFVDVLRLARRVHRRMPRHSLSLIAEHYGVINDNAHRAVSDCIATHECYLRLKDDILSEYGDLEVFKKTFKKRSYKASAADIKADSSKFDPSCPLYGRRVSFSGSLRKLNRMGAMQHAADLGAILQNAVTQKTDFLILSDKEKQAALKGKKSRKYTLAESLINSGASLKVMSEGEFYKVIGLC